MLALKDLIARLPVPGLKESYERQQIAKCVENACGVPVTTRAVTVKDGILTLRVPPVFKSALHARKQGIISALALEQITITDIR
jgi:hypothetical protein